MNASSDESFERAAQTTAGEARTLAWKIALLLRGLDELDAGFAAGLREEILAILGPDAASRGQPAPQVGRPRIVAGSAVPAEPPRERLPEIELSILDIVREDESATNLSAIYERLQDLNDYSITKASLSVRLHRMVKSGRLASPSRGFYELPGGSHPRTVEPIADLRTRR
ncbi:hypothetical protein [Labrys wisconsinensis]|uniref:Transcriptional regulator n=1 Tax=Labrys wisconsinensis TaxID=425677 RepID=A0ABU0JMN1_9HYPH|nr:hypothetical protein [Labrys wisconsinensis]MDQ0474407.1 hypothetical protein [Labrys wisconsinensis]